MYNKTTWMALNVVAHYIVYSTLIFRAYVLAGLNYLIWRSKTEDLGFGGLTVSGSDIGLNLGAGIEYALAAGFLFFELKYVLTAYNQLVLAVGYRHRLSR